MMNKPTDEGFSASKPQFAIRLFGMFLLSSNPKQQRKFFLSAQRGVTHPSSLDARG
jgi:hypothetical protein